MAKYFIQDETLTNLADKIRILNGTEESMTPAQMDSNLNDANNEVDVQSALIDQLSEMLEGKAIDGGNSSTPTNPSASPKAVNFRDYDGTVLYSYTKDEALALTSLPPLPTQQGLTCQGWNWSLEDMKSHVTNYEKLEVGATYITDDGKTRIYITLQEYRKSPMLGVCPNGTVTVDWGDGSYADILTGTDVTVVQWTPTHNYANAGDYVITLTVDGSMGFYGEDSSKKYSGILRHSSSSNGLNSVYQNSVKKIEIGNNVTSVHSDAFSNCYSLKNVTIPNNIISIQSFAFNYCYSLEAINIPNGVTTIQDRTFACCYLLKSATIPNGVTSIGTYAFNTCYALTNITIPSGVISIGNYAFKNCDSFDNIIIPDGVTSIGNYAFNNCYCLKSITIPNSVNSIGTYAFYECRSLKSINIPNGVTTINAYTFNNCYSLTNITIPSSVTNINDRSLQYCYSLAKLRFNSITPPTVASTTALSGFPTDCVISVPTGSLSAYTSAKNYPSSSTYTYIEEN